MTRPLLLSSRLDRIAERAHRAGVGPETMLPLEQLAALVAVAAFSGDSTAITIPLPASIANRFPDAGEWNHGRPPHATVCFVSETKLANPTAVTVAQLVRHACRKVAPFKLKLDVGGGLQSFGPTSTGEQALWLRAVSEPRGELERLHQVIRFALQDEGVAVGHQATFIPHVTWAYVPDADANPTSNAFARWQATVAAAFRDMVPAWDVLGVDMVFPRGVQRAMLNPRRPPKINGDHMGLPPR